MKLGMQFISRIYTPTTSGSLAEARSARVTHKMDLCSAIKSELSISR